MLDQQSDTLSRTQAKHSSSKALIKRSAPDAARNEPWVDDTKTFPNLISDLLNDGHGVKFRAPGYSMYPTILNRDVITVEPIKPSAVKIGDIVLCQVQESLIAHRVTKILKRSERDSRSAPQGSLDRSGSPTGARPSSETLIFILRGDARPACDAPVAAEQILGKVVLIESNGRLIDPYGFKVKLISIVRRFASGLKRSLIPV